MKITSIKLQKICVSQRALIHSCGIKTVRKKNSTKAAEIEIFTLLKQEQNITYKSKDVYYKEK